MKVKKRVKRGVKKGMKRVKSTPPGTYAAGAGLLVGGAGVILLATTKSGQELLARTVQLMLQPAGDDQESQESDVQDDARGESAEDTEEEPEEETNGEDEFDVQEDMHDEPENTSGEEEPEEDTGGEDGSEVTDLKPRNQRPRSPRSKAPGLRKATSA